MKIGLVGWGVETQSAFRYFGDTHEYVIFNEEPRDDFPETQNVAVQALSAARKPGLTGNANDLSYLHGLEHCEKIIMTPAARKNVESVFGTDHPLWECVTSTVQIFFETCPTKNIIGVTGTKGKGTTTTLIAKMLDADGKTVHIGGNIGILVLDFLQDIQPDHWVVLELSSFQLYKFPYSPHIAVHLMMIPEHIEEWHKTMDDYVQAKRNIFAHQKDDDIAIYHPKNDYSQANAQASSGKKIPYLQSPGAYVEHGKIIIAHQPIIDVVDVALPGKHNIENVCAALTAVWQISENVEAYRSVLQQFSGLEHRLQLVREVEGVQYINDTFGTTPDTAVVAMDAYDAPKVMIIGGHDKGNDFSQLYNRLMQDDVKTIICIGITGKKTAETLLQRGFPEDKLIEKDNPNDWTMQDIVLAAQEAAQPGDIVLLSTGSASFGIFQNYKERGVQFIEEVKKL